MSASNGKSSGDDGESDTCQYIIGKDQAPGIINNEMLNRVIREAQGPSLEAIRLCRNVAIEYNTISDLHLEFLNILKIDHLWMFTNLRRLSLKCNKLDKIENLDNLIQLRELDLSFNCIECIENLDCLVRLERLSLFRNNIRRIENLAHLKQMVRLSIGNNLIDSVNGITSLRSMRKLYSLNLDGNPIVDTLDGNIDFRLYIAAHLPDVKYYDYSIITADEREKGRGTFKSGLRVMEENEMEQLAQEDLEHTEGAKLKHLANCFVENLDKNQLFDRLFSNNKHKQRIETHEIEINHIVEQYRLEILKQTQEICASAMDNYQIRCQEIRQYKMAISESRNAAQRESIELIDIFVKEKNDSIAVTKSAYYALAENIKIDVAEQTNECELLHQKYETLIDNLWYSLMEKETTLHECIEEIRIYFSTNITTIVNQFMDSVQSLFAVARIASEEYFKMFEEKIHGQKINDEQLNKFCSLDRAAHSAVIDRCESDLLFQAKKWLSQRLDKYQNEENESNRLRILEINNFLDAQRNEYSQIFDDLVKQLRLPARC